MAASRSKTSGVKSKNGKISSSEVSLVPLGERVLLRPVEEEKETKTASGIFIPESANMKDQNVRRGKIVAVGSGKTEDGKAVPLSVSVGNTVLFSWGDEITVDGVDYVLVNEANILAIIK